MNKEIIEILESGCISGGEFNESLDYKKVQRLVSLFALEVNSFSYKTKDIADELAKDRVVKNIFLEICESYVIALHIAAVSGIYDDRNRIAVERGNILYRLEIGDRGLAETIAREIKSCRPEYLHSYFAALMSREHRTLQQSFSSIVFYMLYTYGRQSLKKEIKKAIDRNELCSDFWRMPLI